MREIWADTIVEESNLSQNISILRRVLGEKRGEHQFIVTVPGKGYKFVASVSQQPEVQSPKPLEFVEPSGEQSDGSPKTENQRANLADRKRKSFAFAGVVLLIALSAAF